MLPICINAATRSTHKDSSPLRLLIDPYVVHTPPTYINVCIAKNISGVLCTYLQCLLHMNLRIERLLQEQQDLMRISRNWFP